MDNTKEKSEFEDYLLPVVMFDPVEFDSPEHADSLFLLQSSLWGTLLSNTDKYTYDESAMLVVPASDLDVYAAKLYGPEIKLQHQTIEEFRCYLSLRSGNQDLWRSGYGADQPIYPSG